MRPIRLILLCRGVFLQKETCRRVVDVMKLGWTPDSCKVTNVHKTCITVQLLTEQRMSGRRPPLSTPDYILNICFHYGISASIEILCLYYFLKTFQHFQKGLLWIIGGIAPPS